MTTTTKELQAFAVDWSGAVNKSAQRRKIWIAETRTKGQLAFLENGMTRDEVGEFLLSKAKRNPNLVVGLDFAFSFPSWFLNLKRCSTARAFWKLAAEESAHWLKKEEEEWPFFSKGSWSDVANPYRDRPEYRATESQRNRPGKRPETVFRLIGQRQVGKGSIRGMPLLSTLKSRGFNIWPFDLPEFPLVVEIYPRWFYGSRVKSSHQQCLAYWEKHFPKLERVLRERASCNDDSFDAAVSALNIFNHRDELLSLPRNPGMMSRLEGWIWRPGLQ